MKAAFYTLGCKVNQYETEYMSELLKKAGFEIVPHDEKADYYIINSCTVTATADQKTRQSVRRFKRRNPDSVVILTGCMPQAFPEDAQALEQADIVLSNKNDFDILSLINEYELKKSRLVHIEKHEKGDEFRTCSINEFSDRIRAFVKIEDGCDRFCSYCIIPMARGRVRSKDPKDLEKEVKTLADSGIKEIVLVGINLSAYGKGKDYDIADAVEICAKTKGIERVRLGSLEPDHLMDDILKKLSATDKFCPQFHISLQSGCDNTLKSMNRHYTADEYAKLCEKIRKIFNNSAITTDIMVGFNGESEDDFRDCFNFVKSIGFEKVHVFPYSERPGTAASRKGDSVPKHIKEERASKMIEMTEKIRNDYFKNTVEKTVGVLIENEIEPGIFQGYTENYIPVRIKSGDKTLIGKIISVTVTDYCDDYCIAE